MTLRPWLPVAFVALLLAAAGAGLVLTRDPPPSPAQEAASAGGPGGVAPAAQGTPGKAAPRRERVVDTAPVLTARRLGALAETPEEAQLARQAARLSDHAVDLAFAEALRRIAEEPQQLPPDVKPLADARTAAQTAADAASGRVDALVKKLTAAPGGERAAIVDELEVARAQAELARDELEDATERLAAAGGDPQARIQRLRAAYDAAQKEPAAGAGTPAAAAPDRSSSPSLLSRLRTLAAKRDKRDQLERARQDALERVKRLTGWRDRVTARLQPGASGTPSAAAPSSASAPAASAPAPTGSAPATAAGAGAPIDEATRKAMALHQAAQDRRRLTAIARLIQDHQELADVYAEWTGVARAQVRAALHRVLEGVLVLLAIVALVLLATRVVDRLFSGREQAELRAGTLRTVVRLALQAAGLIAILFVVLGTPGQVTTILGLAGAGLTVALKDFIVAFFGWFVLMGRNGIRVGDWVEIKGVGGEVAEIGILHTVLLETGSWSDAGHPTGRRVSFVNSFAIEGHYFNFSTSGQWMWDVLQLVVPPGQDPYPIVDALQRLVEQVTAKNAGEAEAEWQKSTSRYRVRTFSAVPGINIAPTSNGIQLDVRYITRAWERHDVRRKLYQAAVELMHGKKREDAGAGAA